MTSGWGWRRVRAASRRNWTFLPFSAFGVAIPWTTLAILLILLRFLSGSLTAAEGVLFDLPESTLAEGERTDLVALVLAMPTGTLVFFDDARYALDDGVSASTLGARLSERVRQSGCKTLLFLSDRNVRAGDLMKLAALSRASGFTRVLFANKREARSE